MDNPEDREVIIEAKSFFNTGTWQVILTVIGILLGGIGAFVYFGGSLRQIDINSLRLTTIEERGSPAVQSLLNQFGDVKNQVAKLDEIATKLPVADAEQRAIVAGLRARLEHLDQEMIDMQKEHLLDVQRLAALETVAAILWKNHMSR